MPRASHHALKLRNKKPKKHLLPIYAATLLLGFHVFVIGFINSSFLEKFIDTTQISLVYTAGSVVSVFLFLFISHVLHAFGNFRLTMSLLAIDLAAVVGMALATSAAVAIPLFLLHIIIVPFLIFNIDVFMEDEIGEQEGDTGGQRGLLLALLSVVGATSPFIGGFLVEQAGNDFSWVYTASALALLPIALILIARFRNFKDPEYSEIKILKALKVFMTMGDIRYVFFCSFILQMFFFAMVVYSPLYLVNHIGLTWLEFGTVMFFAQLAYVFFEYPIGIIADRYIGEKEMMAVGFLILAISTAWISFVTAPSVLIWSIIMFVTRTGASFVEVTTESHFFKQTKGSDAQIISFFRITRPLAYVVGAVFIGALVALIEFNLIFIAVAATMIPAMFFTLQLTDSK